MKLAVRICGLCFLLSGVLFIWPSLWIGDRAMAYFCANQVALGLIMLYLTDPDDE